jgi:drug/metabolite transporter (DMT)-like permease
MTGTFFIMLACLTWALDTLIRYPLLNQGYSTLQIVLFEHITLVTVTFPLIWRYRSVFKSMEVKSYLGLFFIGGIGSALGTLAFTEAFHYLNPTVVILLQKLQPIVAIITAYFFLKERIERHFIQWAVLILGGSLVMIWPDIMGLSQTSLYYVDNLQAIMKGYGYTLLAVVAWGAATVCGKYLSMKNVPSNAIMSGRFLSGAVVLAILAIQSKESLTTMTTGSLSSLVCMALLSGLLGMWLYYRGLKRIRAQYATLAEMTFPVFAAVINWVFLDMSLTSYQVIGAFLLVVGNIGLRLKELSSSLPQVTVDTQQA